MGVPYGFGPRVERFVMNGLAGLLKGARLSDGGALRFWAERVERFVMMNGLAGLLKGARLSDGGALRFWAERVERFDDEWACGFAQGCEVK
ncbi:hypothetical protein [Bartonella sp. B1098]|uniref:hypothetical protein n=1 Tax=Bartonella sp. B1098 TaxID=2911421 RepID=UPI0020C29FFC|nr:hypothetical protein [Bartonella sp. B1098]